MLKAAQSFELNWCHHMTILCFFLCSRQHERCSNFDILHNKCPARLTNISSNLDTDILPPWPQHKVMESIGYIVSSLPSCVSLSTTPSLSHTNLSMQSLRDNEQSFSPSLHHRLLHHYSGCLIKREKQQKGWSKSELGMSSPFMAPMAIEGVTRSRRRKRISFILPITFPPLFYASESVCLLYSST